MLHKMLLIMLYLFPMFKYIEQPRKNVALNPVFNCSFYKYQIIILSHGKKTKDSNFINESITLYQWKWWVCWQLKNTQIIRGNKIIVLIAKGIYPFNTIGHRSLNDLSSEVALVKLRDKINTSDSLGLGILELYSRWKIPSYDPIVITFSMLSILL